MITRALAHNGEFGRPEALALEWVVWQQNGIESLPIVKPRPIDGHAGKIDRCKFSKEVLPIARTHRDDPIDRSVSLATRSSRGGHSPDRRKTACRQRTAGHAIAKRSSAERDAQRFERQWRRRYARIDTGSDRCSVAQRKRAGGGGGCDFAA